MKKIKFIFLIMIFIVINSFDLQGRSNATAKNPITTLEHRGFYKFLVPGEWRVDVFVGVGIEEIEYGFWYANIKASILGDVSEITVEDREELKNWGKSKKIIEEYGKSIFGDEISEIEVFDKLEDGLSFKLKRRETEFYVKVNYKLTNNYIAEFIGFSELPSDNEKLARNTKFAATSFEDNGPSVDGRYDKTKYIIGSKWKFQGIHDPFLVIKYYFDRAERPEPSDARKATDYTIKWKSEGLGMLMGEILNKNFNEIKSSDLNNIHTFKIWRVVEGDTHYTITVNDLIYNLPIPEIGITQLDDFLEFKNLTELGFELSEYKDLKPILKMIKLRSLTITPNASIKSLRGIDQLVNLRELDLNGKLSDRVTDISPLAKLPHLQIIHFVAPGVKDLTPLLKLKNLRYVFIVVHEDARRQSIIDARDITNLRINRDTYR